MGTPGSGVPALLEYFVCRCSPFSPPSDLGAGRLLDPDHDAALLGLLREGRRHGPRAVPRGQDLLRTVSPSSRTCVHLHNIGAGTSRLYAKVACKLPTVALSVAVKIF